MEIDQNYVCNWRKKFQFGEIRSRAKVLVEMKVDWKWIALEIKVSAKKLLKFSKLLLSKLGFYTIRVFIVWSLFNAIIPVL